MTEAPMSALVLNKTNATAIANKCVQMVEDGEQYATETLAKLAFLAECIEQAIKRIRPMAIEELHGDKAATVGGVTLQVKEAGVKYDYSQDDEWQELSRRCKDAELLRKQCEERLRQAGECFRTASETVAVVLPK